MKWLSFIFTLILLGPPLWLGGEGLQIVGVQLQVDESMYQSIDSFASAIESELRAAAALAADGSSPDLVAFPEYTSVFLALLPYMRQVTAHSTVDESLNAILASENGPENLYDLFVMEAPRVEMEMDSVWGEAARKYDTAIVAGTYFAADGGVLKNRLVVYDTSGHRAYEQDKVFLTEFELDFIGLKPGSLDDAVPFEFNGYSIASTICRDTFFPVWGQVFVNADYWIDIKANGVEFTEDIAHGFFDALSERISQTGASGGMTVCLTGSFLDLFWEGQSFIVSNDSGEVEVSEGADSYRGAALLRDTVEDSGLRKQ